MVRQAAVGPRVRETRIRFIAFIGCAIAVLLLVYVGMLVPLLGGLLAYSLIDSCVRALTARKLVPGREKLVAALLFLIGLVVIIGLVLMSVHVVLHDGAGFHELFVRMADILASTRAWLPESINEALPQTDALFSETVDWLKEHAAELGGMSLNAVKQIGYALIGILLGALIALAHHAENAQLGPASKALLVQVVSLRTMFVRVASAQVKISAVNTTLTAIYLMVVLPLFGVHLPLTKTLTTATFVTGLIPVVGNLLSNSAVTIISFGYSVPVAIASLAFLVGVHKLEYFLNARIVGHEINAASWEILIAMVVLERFFGLPGVVVAPIFYAWLKHEWHVWDTPGGAAAVDPLAVS